MSEAVERVQRFMDRWTEVFADCDHIVTMSTSREQQVLRAADLLAVLKIAQRHEAAVAAFPPGVERRR